MKDRIGQGVIVLAFSSGKKHGWRRFLKSGLNPVENRTLILIKMLTIEEINDAAELHRFQKDWENLASNVKEADFFHTYEWITTWLECFWKDKPISFLFGYDGEDLITLAPFLQDVEGELWCPKSLVTPINGESRRTNILCSRNSEIVLDSLVKYFLKKQDKIRLVLKNVRKESSGVKFLLQAVQNHNLSYVVFEKAASPILRFNSDWETYLNSRSSRFRGKLRKISRLLEKAGVKYVTYTDVDHCDRAMEDILTVEKNSWKEKTGTSFTSGVGLEDFYRGFARKAAEKGWLNLDILYLNSRPVAHAYGLVYNNEHFILKLSYDDNYKKFTPGYAVLWYSIQNAFQKKLEIFDFLGGPSRIKKEFSNDIRQHIDVCVFSKKLFRCSRCRIYQTSIKPFIKQKMPFFVSIKKRLKQ